MKPPGASTSPLISSSSASGMSGIVGIGMHRKRLASRRPCNGMKPVALHRETKRAFELSGHTRVHEGDEAALQRASATHEIAPKMRNVAAEVCEARKS